MQIGQDAMDEARKQSVELVREMKATVVNRPAVGHRKARQKRLGEHRAFLGNPLAPLARYDELAARFQPPPDKPVPRRLIREALFAARELGEEDEDA
jgi:hypothetical protein